MKKSILSCEYIFFLLFIFTQLIGTILKMNTQMNSNPHLTIANVFGILLISVVLAYPIAVFVGRILDYIRTKYQFGRMKSRNMCNNKSWWLFVWIGMLIIWLPCLLAYYPGIFSYDISAQWDQYFGFTQYSTHHPIIHTLLMGGIIDVGEKILGDYNKGVFCYCLIQLLFLSGVVSYAIYCINRLIPSKKIFIVTTIYFALYPVYPLLGISTTKDAYFSIFFLLSFILLLNSCFLGITKKRFILTVLSLTISLLFRNNAIYGVILSILFINLFMIKKECPKKKFVPFFLIFLLSIILAKCLFGAFMKVTDASEGSIRESLSIPCQQIARVYTEKQDELTEEEKNEIFQYISEENIANYRYQLADPIKGNLNTVILKKDWKRFFDLWIRLGCKYPREYMEATLCNTLPLWYVGDESMVTVHGVYMESAVKDVTDGKVVRNSQLPRLERVLTNFFGKGYILQIPIISLLFIPAFYVWIIIASFFLMIKYKKYTYLVLPIFLLGYTATLMAGPCILPRYCANFMLCVPPLMICTGISMLKQFNIYKE